MRRTVLNHTPDDDGLHGDANVRIVGVRLDDDGWPPEPPPGDDELERMWIEEMKRTDVTYRDAADDDVCSIVERMRETIDVMDRQIAEIIRRLDAELDAAMSTTNHDRKGQADT